MKQEPSKRRSRPPQAEMRSCSRNCAKSYVQSVERQVDLLERSRCDGNWNVAAMRLKGLAASFHSRELLQLAEQALDTAPGDPAVVRRLKTYIRDFALD